MKEKTYIFDLRKWDGRRRCSWGKGDTIYPSEGKLFIKSSSKIKAWKTIDAELRLINTKIKSINKTILDDYLVWKNAFQDVDKPAPNVRSFVDWIIFKKKVLKIS